MPRVFISYSRNDKIWVSGLADKLDSSGYQVWWDPEILPGQDFGKIIRNQLEASHCVISVWSKSSVNSKWVREESSYALQQNKLIPVLMEQVTPPMPFGQVHTESLINWKNDEAHSGYQKLIKAINLLAQEKPLKPKQHKKTLLENRFRLKSVLASLGVLTLFIAIAFHYISGTPTSFNREKKPDSCFNSHEIHNLSDNLDNKSVLIPTGKFIVGKKTKHSNTLQEVTIEQPFHIDAYEVTNKQYQTFLVKSKTQKGNPLIPQSWNNLQYTTGKDFYPVVGVNLHSAKKYCHSVGKRLPETWEWEIACRYFTVDSKKQTKHCSELNTVGSYNGEKPTIFNMMDNVSEWTNSLQKGKVYNSEKTKNINEGKMIAKGHNHTMNKFKLSCIDNINLSPSSGNIYTGFRCVR